MFFFGDEAVRVQRGKDEVRVLIKFSKNLREQETTLENIKFFLENGKKVGFFDVANYYVKKADSIITRGNRHFKDNKNKSWKLYLL